MGFQIRRADYYYATIHDLPETGAKLLTDLAEAGVNLLAFAAVPVGPTRTQLTLFADDDAKLEDAARRAGLALLRRPPRVVFALVRSLSLKISVRREDVINVRSARILEL